MSRSLLVVLILWLGTIVTGYAQAPASPGDSLQLDARKILAFALEGDIPAALRTMEVNAPEKLLARHRLFKKAYEDRFRYEKDRSNFLDQRRSSIDSVLKIYRDYWRASFLDSPKKYDTLLKRNLVRFLGQHYKPSKKLSLSSDDDTMEHSLKGYIQSFGLHTAGYGRTGKLRDLLVWKREKDTTYTFMVKGEKISARVIFMEDFITLGWEEYATLDKLYPGGWATREALYCVKKAYDLKSETFLISYLAHEGRHFSDYKLFPNLSSPDLEYRAKLTELSMANTTLYQLIDFFIQNANYNSDNGHQVANYCAIRDLSKKLFNTEFEKNIDSWKKLTPETIHTGSDIVLQENTAELKKTGKTVARYIKP